MFPRKHFREYRSRHEKDAELISLSTPVALACEVISPIWSESASLPETPVFLDTAVAGFDAAAITRLVVDVDSSQLAARLFNRETTELSCALLVLGSG